jgi:hypothetical protein
MSLHKVEHWKVSWLEDGTPRRRRLELEPEARSLARELEKAGRRSAVTNREVAGPLAGGRAGVAGTQADGRA